MARDCAIGVDIGGTVTKIALVQEDGTILRQTHINTGSHSEPEEYLQRLKGVLRELTADDARPKGIGLALPGFLSPDRHQITFNPNTPALVGYDFFDLLEPLGFPLYFEQDLNVPAVAEYHLGAGRGSRRLMSASIGTGLGAAVIIDGKLLDFSSHTVGDSGHVILDPNGPTCAVGCHGCGEAMVSTAAIERRAMQAVRNSGSVPPWAEMSAGRVPARAVIEACQEGDPLAVAILSETGEWLGQWVASLAPIFLPDTVVLCGGVAEAGEPLRAACERRFLEIAGPEYTQCTIKSGVFKGLAGVIGAAVPLLLD